MRSDLLALTRFDPPPPLHPPVILAVHGILTGQTSLSWLDKLHAHHLFRSAKVVKCEYTTGPCPRWNYFWKNRRLALRRANELEAFRGRVYMVGHSNGSDIVVRVASELADRGITTHCMILSGSVTYPSVRRNGLLQLVETGYLERAVAYCSAADLPLRIPFRWPYRDLGRRGWREVPLRFAHRFGERWFSGGHSGYFAPNALDRTFRLIATDFGLVVE